MCLAGKRFTKVLDITKEHVSSVINVRARVDAVRTAGAKLCFLVLRQRTGSVQSVISLGDKVSKAMVKFCATITPESIIDMKALVLAVDEKTTCSQSDVELSIQEIFVVSPAEPRLPIQIADCSRTEADIAAAIAAGEKVASVSTETRLDNRHLDLRTRANQAIFKVQSAVCMLFREYLISQGFQEIHSPKLISAASEGNGAEVFKLNYFGTDAFLAQSPQLYKQMAINSDFDRVFEIAPVFRAEKSLTKRHMTEFVGLDLEMAFNEHYHEALDVLEQLFVSIFKGLQTQFAGDIATVGEQYAAERFEFLEPSLRLEWHEGIAMLREAGETIGDFEDLSTPMEKRLGALVKAKYHTDFYILDKFPLCIRPFYTMPSPDNENYSNSYDLMMRGQEIMSGAQRIHDYKLLKERAELHEIPLHTIESYLNSFKYGGYPHAGGGVGMERVVMLFLGLDDIRKTSMFPRDPKRCTP